MPKASQLSFNGGEFTEFMDPRVDVAKYSKGCKKLENFEPVPFGSVLCRAGTVHGGEAKFADRDAIVIPFAFSPTTTFDIEVGHEYFRFWKDQAPVMDGGSPLEVSSPYQEGELYQIQFEQQNDVVYISHPSHDDRRLVRNADDDWTLEIVDYSDSQNYPALDYENFDETKTLALTGVFGDVGETLTITANHNRFESSDVGDHVMISHDRDETELKHPVSAVNNSAPFYVLGDWVFQTEGVGVYEVKFEESEDKVNWKTRRSYKINGTQRNIETTGSEQSPKFFRVNITAFTSADGASPPFAIIEVADAAVRGLIKIDTVATAQSATGTVIEPFHSGDASHQWAEEYFSDKKGHARAVCFHKDRRCLASKDIWLSQPGNYENFRRRNDADSAFRVPVRISGSPFVNWMQSLRDLRVGTTTAECVLVAENTSEVFAFNNYDLREDSNFGSKYVRAEKVNGTALFLQPEGRTVRSQVITGIEEYFDANTLTTLADHILDSGVIQTAFQRQRYPTWHGVRADGQLASLLYEQAQNVQAWYRTVTDGEIQSIAVTPMPDEEDRISYVVKRTVDGATVRHIEFKALGQYRNLQDIGFLQERVDELEREKQITGSTDEALLASLSADLQSKQNLMWFVDDGKRVTGTDMETITGLEHLEGKTVAILADGARMEERIVSGGQITLDYPCQSVTVGIPYDYTLQPMNLESAGVMGRSKNISGAIIRLWRSGPAYARIDNGRLTRLSLPLDQLNNAPTLQTGDSEKIHLGGDWERNTAIEITGRSPLPVNIQAITLEFEIGKG